MPENDITELQTLDIYQLTEEQYNDLISSSEFDLNAIYMTPAGDDTLVKSVNGELPDANGNVDIDALPTGGTSGQYLVKQSSTAGDASWQTLPTYVQKVNNISPTNGNVNITIPTVDQTYSSSSTNAQSGTAVASAISTKQNTVLSGMTEPTSSQGQNGDIYILYTV